MSNLTSRPFDDPDVDAMRASDQVPGFMDGKIGGKVYFIRLKYGTGVWDAYSEGTRNLLSFANKYFPCEAEQRPMSAEEIHDNDTAKNMTPSFLYVYCDDSFKLTDSEATVLQNYVASGGFLFLDSRPDPAINAAVTAQLRRILPGSALTRISKSDSINRFEFRLGTPATGENFMGIGDGVPSNYGIRQNGRLVVFYTMGNLSHLYEQQPPSASVFARAQYQMGVNVIAYAIEKGNISIMSPMKGAE